jgi:diaminobutyrate-2-oxoglutarate transaminase
MLEDSHSGLDLPAAFILETVQAEGGIYAAPPKFLQQLRTLCDRYRILLIVDDVQAGCGRTGTFFSFEDSGIVPDIVCLSKSIGGCGLPMSLVLMKRAVDVWSPGDHTGTFRGNQLAFVAAAAALEHWEDRKFSTEVFRKGELTTATLARELSAFGRRIEIRGKGLLIGIDFANCGGAQTADKVSALCFENGLIVETCGRGGSVVKLLPPLTIAETVLREGLEILTRCIREAIPKAAAKGN